MSKPKNDRKLLPSKSDIILYWKYHLIKEFGKFNSEKDITEHICFACGCYKETARCHIKAYAEGGSNKPDNLHLLCEECHRESEYYSNESYFYWFENKNPSIEIKKHNDVIHHRTYLLLNKVIEYNYRAYTEHDITKFILGDWSAMVEKIDENEYLNRRRIIHGLRSKYTTEIKDMYNLIFNIIRDSYISVNKLRIKNGLNKAKSEGKHCGRRKDSCMTEEQFIEKYPNVIQDIKNGLSVRKTAKSNNISPNTVQRLKKLIVNRI